MESTTLKLITTANAAELLAVSETVMACIRLIMDRAEAED